MVASNRPSWLLFVLGMGQALVLCLGILVLFLGVVPELPEPSAASAGLFTLILGWVMLKPRSERRGAEHSERNAFIPPVPSPATILAPALPAPLPAREEPSRRNRWAFGPWIGALTATAFAVTVGTLLGPQWWLTLNHGLVEPVTAGLETVVEPSPGKGPPSTSQQPTRVDPPPPTLPPPAMPPPAMPPSAPPRPSTTPSPPRPLPSAPRAAPSIGPRDLLVLVPIDSSPALSSFSEALGERLDDRGSKLFMMRTESTQGAPSSAQRVLTIRALQSEDLPSTQRVKFVRIIIDSTVSVQGVEKPFRCAHNGMGGSESVALQQAADRCVRELLDQLGI